MTAYPLLLDARAAGVVGAFLQRSGATDLSGMEQDTDPLRPHLRAMARLRRCHASVATARLHLGSTRR